MASQIQNDEPAVVDNLDRARFAAALARVIENCATPLVIGVYGTWGIGKTSLMRQIRDRLAQAEKIRTIWFDPWQHQFDEEPAVALLHTLVDQLKLGDEGKKLLTVIAGALGSLLLKVTTTLSTADLQELGEKYEQERFQIREKQVRLQQYFAALIGEASEDNKYRLVFFIDDLDRCVPEQVLKVLEALKLYLNLPSCVYVVGVDRSALECSIRQRYKEQEVKEAEYLDKIVQLPFTIPPIAQKAMRGFIETLLPAELAPLMDLLVVGLGDNPRQVKRFVNALLLNHELASTMFGASYDPRLLAGILIVQYRQPELFKAATADPNILKVLSEGGEPAKQYEEFVKNDRRLAQALPLAGFSKAERITHYIYLSEVAGVRAISYEIVLTASGPNKINIIKAVKDRTNLGLKECKDLVDNCPSLISSEDTREAAEAFSKKLRDLGASAEIR
jgi:ribosomal protein L7/L12